MDNNRLKQRLKEIALGLMIDNQNQIDIEGSRDIYVYSSGYNDGIIALLLSLEEEFDDK